MENVLAIELQSIWIIYLNLLILLIESKCLKSLKQFVLFNYEIVKNEFDKFG